MKDDTNCDALEDNDSTRKIIEINVEEIDMLKVWKDDCSVNKKFVYHHLQNIINKECNVQISNYMSNKLLICKSR